MFKTALLKLRRLSFLELDGPYINWFNDKDVCKYNSHGEELYTKEKALAFIAGLRNDPSCEVYAVYLGTKHIGNVAIQKIDKRNKSAELALIFGDKEEWGKGYATEACEFLVKRAFNELGLHRLYFGTHVDNIGMKKVGEKLGFIKEGILKEAALKNGSFNDVVIYGLINR